jgi:hypothetical protein
MGCLPTFKHISWAAPVLLILLRLGQGLARDWLLGRERHCSCVSAHTGMCSLQCMLHVEQYFLNDT